MLAFNKEDNLIHLTLRFADKIRLWNAF